MNVHKLAATFTEDGKIMLTGLPFNAGDSVEIVFLEKPREKDSSHRAKSEHPLQGTVLHYDDPFESAVSAEDWEILK